MAARTIRTIRLCLGLAALLIALPAFAGQVYTWKDAKGVTHYSDSPPPQKDYKKTLIADTPAAPAAKAEDPRCTIARQNLEKIRGAKGPVGLDANGDGKLDKEMTEAEIDQHVKNAESTVKYTCAPAAE